MITISMRLPSSAPDEVMVIYFARKKVEKENGVRTERPAVIKNASMPARRSPFLPFSGPTGEQLWLRGLGQTKPNLVAKKLLFICYLHYLLYGF
jgi:hypothetical protein